jgi:FkbM family methyltransferase
MVRVNSRLRHLRALIEEPAPVGPAGFGPLSRVAWRIGARLGRHEREHLNRVLLGILDELDSLEQGAGRPVINPGSGQQVVNWYGPAVQGALASTGFDAIVTSVPSEVGDMLYPTFDRFMLPSVRATGSWEAEEAEFVRSHLGPGGRALNVGANVGFMTMVMSRAVGPEGLVIAIEPEPFNFGLLWENVRRNRATNVLPIHAAAGEETGSIRLNLSPDNSGDHRTAHHPVGVSSIEVPLIAVDEVLGDMRIDVVAIDAQGFDHRIVRGMAQLIARCRPPMLVEFWPTGILELDERPTSVIDEYRDLGYRVELFSRNEDVTGLRAEEIVAMVLEEKDHGTLALT